MPGEVKERVLRVIAETQHIPLETVTLEKTFQELKIDSLDAMNIVFAVESEFDISIPDAEAARISTVREVVEGIEQLLAAKQSG